MKITMLGTTGAGKTCYMLGMYAFMSVGLRGFTISATDLDIDLDFTNRWESLVEGEGEERWPKGNDANIYNYAFNFNYAARPIMGFEWIDYRGGALRDRSNQTDVQELMQYIKDSQCLFLCVSGEYLTQPIVESDGTVNYTVRQKVAQQLRLQAMNKLLTDIQQKLNPSNTNPFPIAVVVTKFDLCMHRSKAEIVKDIQQLFEPLFQPKSGWLSLICPVSLGRELAADPMQGAIEPVNVHLPVAFAVYARLRSIAAELKAQETSISSDLDKEKARNFFKKWLNSERIGSQENRLHELENKFEVIRNNLVLLSQELRSANIYLGDQEVQVDNSF
jgi:GTPase SAR1 family protein